MREGDPGADAHDHHDFFFPDHGAFVASASGLAGTVVTGLSRHFGVHCLPVVLFLTPPCGGREKTD